MTPNYLGERGASQKPPTLETLPLSRSRARQELRFRDIPRGQR